MKNLIKLICIIVLTLSVNSCGVQFRYNTLNTAGYVDTLRSEGLVVEEINSVSQLRWKLQTDWNFANDYWWFLQQQNYSFFHNQYFNNRLYRYGWQSPHDYWMNWQWNTPHRWSIFGYDRWGYNAYGWNGWNQYPWYGNWNSNYWWNYQNRPYGYSHIYGPRTSYLGNVYGRRGFSNNNRISTPRTRPSRVVNPQNRNERTIRTTRPRTNTRPVRITNPVRVNPPSNPKPTRPTYQQPQRPSKPVYTRPVTPPRTRPVNTNTPRPTRSTVPQRNNRKGGNR